MLVRRPPHPALAPFVECLWYADSPAGAAREWALPTGAAHLAVRLSDAPVRVSRDLADPGETVGHVVLAGPRAAPHLRDTSLPARSVGVQLRPGAAALLVGKLDAAAIAARHLPLAELGPLPCGPLGALRDHLAEVAATPARGAQACLAELDAALLARLPTAARPPPAVRFALRELTRGDRRVDAVRADTGYSARAFIALFTRWVGLTPKVYARLARFQRVVRDAGRAPWSELARTHGYADQSHLHRDFRAFGGVTPGAYRPLPDRPNHVPVAG